MTTKKDTKKDKEVANAKNKKRDSPDDEEVVNWDATALKDSENTRLLSEDVRQLLITRGELKKNLGGKKIEMIEYLKEKHDVGLVPKYKENVDELTKKELQCELRLRNLDDSEAKKETLIKRLNGEIAPPPNGPPLKKRKKAGRVAGRFVPKPLQVFVVRYTPLATAEEGDPKLLGVFKSKKKAYTRGIERLMEDMNELCADKKKKLDAVHEKLDKMDDDEMDKKLQVMNESVASACDKEDDASYVEINEETVE
mmetsp:Transcript_16710/g.25860  ORF Transcript_16710/g.25860 Transcript_16710/m.25860 type:complete len:254 (+) Transcript_16710:93-854(+)|eukprot:CAMPEP_0202687328 /NCGR_PEP_ID=MMETSP1385-20130828/3018_1 /ASSEMBLY_ACC=CAM_ASM_000861 /TAXON_ID=933848 /ORGANISM="Elphidium margaritaceum" /LENGTH=253 /DNA_ID=CAMNT_0049342099 /DNA_START=86 /DNA_END=847 /DNA_ORIENTATION=-